MRASGANSWVYQYKLGRKTRRITIAVATAIPLGRAPSRCPQAEPRTIGRMIFRSRQPWRHYCGLSRALAGIWCLVAALVGLRQGIVSSGLMSV